MSAQNGRSGPNGELLAGLVKLVPHLIAGAAMPLQQRVEVRVTIEPGATAERLAKAARALSERTRLLPDGVETLKLAKPGALEDFLAECQKAGIDVDEIKERLRPAPARGPILPAEQLVQLTRALRHANDGKK